jgi:NTE family protein
MGGIVALLYSIDGSANAADAVARITLQASEMIRETTIFRVSALSRGRKLRRAAERLLAGKFIADLARPVLTISADLITGQRIVLDRGPVATALMATSAIPGALSPVRTAEHWLVDGALFSRVPVDLLGRWRCGLKIAVGVEGRMDEESEADRAELRRAMSGPFGLPRVIARSWDLLGISQGAAEARTADIVITPDTHTLSAFNFKDVRSFIAAGTVAANRALPDITEAVQKLLQPRAR